MGYFGKSIVDGSAAAQQAEGGSSLQDYALIGVLGLSVLIGVFASQLASETWDAILKEQEEEEKKLQAENGVNDDDTDNNSLITEIFGFELPEWLIGFQYGLQDADERVETLCLQEYDAKVWNYTDAKVFLGMEISKGNSVPDNLNPALVDPTSPEITGRYKGFDFGATTCDGLVLSPILFTYFLKFADPLFDEKLFDKERVQEQESKVVASISASVVTSEEIEISATSPSSTESIKEEALTQLQELKDETKKRLDDIDKRMNQLK